MSENAVEAHPSIDPTPRYFWRRILAFTIDVILYQLAVTVVFSMLNFVSPWNLGSSLSQYNQCHSATSGPLVDKVNALWPLQAGEDRINMICQTVQFGRRGNDIFSTTVVKKSGATTYRRSVSTSIDADGNAIDTDIWPNRVADFVTILLLPFVLALLSANRRRTPGKMAMSLKVVASNGKGPLLSQEVKRELLKLLPVFVSIVAASVVYSLQPKPLGNFDSLLIAMRDASMHSLTYLLPFFGLVAVVAAVWWLLPFVRWRGRTFYDALIGCKVIKI